MQGGIKLRPREVHSLPGLLFFFVCFNYFSVSKRNLEFMRQITHLPGGRWGAGEGQNYRVASAGTKTGGRRQRTGGKTEGRCSKIKHQGSRTPERAEGHSPERDALGGEIRASRSPGVWQSGVLDKQTLSQTGQEHLEGLKRQRVPEEERAWGYQAPQRELWLMRLSFPSCSFSITSFPVGISGSSPPFSPRPESRSRAKLQLQLSPLVSFSPRSRTE